MSSEFLQQIINAEKYRPRKVADVILPAGLTAEFEQFVEQKSFPNLLLVGPPGVGKTSVLGAMVAELGWDEYKVNGSLDRNIDTLRNEMMQHASTVSLMGQRKVIRIEEADYLNPQSTQPALRNFMEEYSKNCSFLMTANYQNKIIEPLRDRVRIIEFKIPTEERPIIAKRYLARACEILESENVEFEREAVAFLIKKYFPSFRKVINELQGYAARYGKIDSGILASTSESDWNALFKSLKAKNFSEVRTWVALHSDIDPATIYRSLFDGLSKLLTPDSIPIVILAIAEYQFKSAFVVDQEINTTACLAEIMANSTWQK